MQVNPRADFVLTYQSLVMMTPPCADKEKLTFVDPKIAIQLQNDRFTRNGNVVIANTSTAIRYNNEYAYSQCCRLLEVNMYIVSYLSFLQHCILN